MDARITIATQASDNERCTAPKLVAVGAGLKKCLAETAETETTTKEGNDDDDKKEEEDDDDEDSDEDQVASEESGSVGSLSAQ